VQLQIDRKGYATDYNGFQWFSLSKIDTNNMPLIKFYSLITPNH